MAKKVKIILPLSLFLLVFQIQAQDVVFIVLLKGNASVKYGGSDQLVNLFEACRLPLPLNTSIILPANSAAIVYNEISKIEIGSSVEEKYKTISLMESLKKSDHGSMTANFYRYMNSMYAQMKEKEESSGTVVGAVSRGSINSPLAFSPADSALILSDTLELRWGSGNTRLMGKLVIFSETKNEAIYNNAPLGNHLLVRSLTPGFYSWNYELAEKGKSKVYKYHNEFIIPTPDQKRICIDEVENFMKEISDLSPEVQKKLREDFLSQKRYYFFTLVK
jgi:hypothetical protein